MNSNSNSVQHSALCRVGRVHAVCAVAHALRAVMRVVCAVVYSVARPRHSIAVRLDCPSPKPCRDIESLSRHEEKTIFVATENSLLCRDKKL